MNASSQAPATVVDLAIASTGTDNPEELDITKSESQPTQPTLTLKTPDASQSLVIIENKRSSELDRWNIFPGVSLRGLPSFKPDVPEFDVSKLASQPFASGKSRKTRVLRRPVKKLSSSSSVQALPTRRPALPAPEKVPDVPPPLPPVPTLKPTPVPPAPS